MALRFDSPELDSGLLFAAPDEFLTELVQVAGSGSFAGSISGGFSGSGTSVVPQRVINVGNAQPPWSFALSSSFSGSGTVEQPQPQVVTGSGTFAVSISGGFTGSGISDVQQVVTGSGLFSGSLGATFAGSGIVHPNQPPVWIGANPQPIVVPTGSGTSQVSLAQYWRDPEGNEITAYTLDFEEADESELPDGWSFDTETGILTVDREVEQTFNGLRLTAEDEYSATSSLSPPINISVQEVALQHLDPNKQHNRTDIRHNDSTLRHKRGSLWHRGGRS